MIRRILVFLAVIFVAFFLYRRYDKVAADNFLVKVKNFSFQKDKTYTTTITNPDGTNSVINSNEIGSSGLRNIMSDTIADKSSTGSQENNKLLDQILTSDNLKNTAIQNSRSVYMDGVTGPIVVNNWPVETISAQPTTVKNTTPVVVKPSWSLSDEDKSQLEKMMDMFY